MNERYPHACGNLRARVLLFTLSAVAFASMVPAFGRATVRAAAQERSTVRAAKLPSPDKILGDYIKAVGGKKRLLGVRDAVYEWKVLRAEQEAGTARTEVKSPSSSRTLIQLGESQVEYAANARSAWEREAGGSPRTLRDHEAGAAKLHALLEASHMLDYRKQNALARTSALGEVGGEPAYVVEFSTRDGARLRCWFAVTSKLLLQTEDEARGLRVRFADYRASAEGGQLEPQRMEVVRAEGEALVLLLRQARYNTGIADASFDPPSEAALDVPTLLRELVSNQADVDKRINDYTFMRKVTERKLNDRGEVTKETTTVQEVYPVAGWGWVMKLVSENGVPLSPERMAKEEKRVAEEIIKAEREAPKRIEERKRKLAEHAAKRKQAGKEDLGDETDDEDLGISTFLRACELVSPRRETFQGREAIVFDFRGRPGFRPSTRAESLASKLVGIIWIDPVDKQVIRLEGRFAQGFKVGGGLLASIKQGSAFVFEQTRLPEGIWLPRYSQVNASAKVLLLAGVTINETHEFSDFKRFSTKIEDATLEGPKKP